MIRAAWYRPFYLWAKQSGLSAATLENYDFSAKIFEGFLKDRGIANVRDVDRRTMSEYPAYLRELRSKCGRPYSTGTLLIFVVWVRKFYLYLQDQGRLLADPTRGLKIRYKAHHLPRAVLTTSEMKKLLQAPDVNTLWGLRDRAILEVLYGTGVRFAELADLSMSDIDVEEGILWVREGKGRRDRVLPMGRWAAYWLKRYVEASESQRRQQGTQRVFLTPRGNRLANWVLNEKLREYLDDVGVGKPATVHAIRHTFATHLIRGGADVREIQKLLGHATLTATQVYTHLDLEDLRKVQRRCHPREKERKGRR